jgi:uncharacterized protein (TIGR02246 family)
MTNSDVQPAQAAAAALIEALIEALVQAWRHGDASAFSKPFSEHIRFVAFDGTILKGPAEVTRFHQRAFTTHLAGTRLRVQIDEIRALGSSVALVFARGGIERDGVLEGALIGDSVQTFVVSEINGRAQIEAFQNTRQRPISGPQQAQVWSDFDRAWFSLGSRA